MAAGIGVTALALGLGAVGVLGSADASPLTRASSRLADRAPAAIPSAPAAAAALGQAVADSAIGLRTAYFEPPSAPDPAAPGTTIISGADQPDPFMAVQGGRYFLFTSQDRVPANVPVRSGTAIGRWGPMTDALPDLPAWATTGNTWAPDVHKFGSHYILYFTAQVNYPGHQIECIGDATSTKVEGPYLAAATPFICQLAQGGSIDPRTFVDADGTPYLLWKSDENSFSQAHTGIYSQQLSPDGEHLVGTATRIFSPDRSWQGAIVEAPRPGAGPRRLPALLFRRLVQPARLRHRGRPLRRTTRPLRRHRPHPTAVIQRAGDGAGGGVGLLRRARGLAALHALPLDLAPARATTTGGHGPAGVRSSRAVPGGAPGGGHLGLMVQPASWGSSGPT